MALKVTTATIRQLFGIESDEELEVGTVAPTFGVCHIPSYVFPKALMRDILTFWRLEKRAAMLTGHKGSGKTSIVEQLHNRMNLNLEVVTGHGKMQFEALFGQYLPTEDGSLRWQDGPVTRAARMGHSVLINEINAIPSDLLISLMDVAHEGGVLTLPEAGEQFMPVQGFRIFGTMNPKGVNDFIYQGRKEMDGAFKERWMWISVPYVARQDEEKILMNVWTSQVEDDPAELKIFVGQMLDVAGDVRALANSTGRDAIPEIISTRVLCNWATYWIQYTDFADSAHKGLERALTNGCSPIVRYTLHKLVSDHTGQPSPYSLNSIVQ